MPPPISQGQAEQFHRGNNCELTGLPFGENGQDEGDARVGAESGWAELSMSFRKIVLERQYYRVLTAAVTHLSAMHLAFNAASLASL